ncbi:hypothetical protein AHAS_Ahas20G0150900 [Arachis hypogaea]
MGLMIQGSVEQFVPKYSTDDAVEVVDKDSIQKVLDIVQNTDVRTTVMENNMQSFEKCLLNIERSFPDLHNSLPHVKGGAETFTAGILTINTQAMRSPSQAQLTGLKLYSKTDECLPNSPGYDDDVIINEQRSTLRPKSHVANSKPPLARKLHWSTGVPKVGISQTIARSSHIIRSTEMIMQYVMQLLSLTHMDCNIEVCELFSGSPFRPRPMKLPKMEPANNDSVPHPAEIPTHRPVLSMGGCVNNQVPLITQAYDMEFRPTMEMDFMYDEVRFAAYIFRKTNETSDYGYFLLHQFAIMIMNIIVMMASIRASRALPPHNWFVPSTMANDILLLKP